MQLSVVEYKECTKNPGGIWDLVPLIFFSPSPGGMATSTWNLVLKGIFSGTLEIWGLSMVMYGGFRYSIRNSL